MDDTFKKLSDLYFGDDGYDDDDDENDDEEDEEDVDLLSMEEKRQSNVFTVLSQTNINKEAKIYDEDRGFVNQNVVVIN